MKKILFLNLMLTAMILPSLVYGCNCGSTSRYSDATQTVCYGTCDDKNYTQVTGYGPPSWTDSNCFADCSNRCSTLTDCVSGGGSSYGGCMGGGYTTGGKPAPKGGPEPKNIKSK